MSSLCWNGSIDTNFHGLVECHVRNIPIQLDIN